MDTVRIDTTTPPVAEPDPTMDRDSGWAAGAHLLALFFSLPGAVVLLVALGRQHPFVRQHARQALNFQINLLLAAFAGMLLSALVPAFLLTWVPLAIGAIALPIVAAVRANRGDWQPYPPLIPFLRALREPAAI